MTTCRVGGVKEPVHYLSPVFFSKTVVGQMLLDYFSFGRLEMAKIRCYINVFAKKCKL